jgi:predicted metal-dependent hydrolase
MNETLFIADLEFEIRRSGRRKTLGLTVDRGGELVVHAPEAASEDELRQWVARKLLWVHKKLALKEDLTGAARHPDFVSGESIFYLGRSYRLKLADDQDLPLRFDGHWFFLRRKDRPEAPRHFQEWYRERGTRWIERRVKAWQSKVNAAPARVTVGDLGFRWGSCGKNGAVHFNWRLLQLPVRQVDYVIVHELAHLQEHNHTPEYWRILDRVLPDWRERKAELESRWQAYATFRMENGRKSSAEDSQHVER